MSPVRRVADTLRVSEGGIQISSLNPCHVDTRLECGDPASHPASVILAVPDKTARETFPRRRGMVVALKRKQR